MKKVFKKLMNILEPYNISKLDIIRMYKYLNVIRNGKQLDDLFS